MSTTHELTRNLWWIRDARNPVLPPGPAGSFDSGCCMNAWVVRVGDEYYLYYAGADDDGHRRVCLAIAPVSDPANWRRLGPLFDNGAPGSFDAKWCVLPHVVQIAPDRWHLYYTGNSGVGEGLSAFPGMGMAISRDGVHWEKYAENPVLARTGVEGDPDAQGIAGGSVLKVTLPNGATEWRWYYTGCPTLGEHPFLDQQKRCCLAVSQDAVHWEKRGAVMLRDADHDYENVAVAGPVVHQREDGTFRMWYSAIGTRWWGVYSIGYAESEDGLTWRRGATYGENMQLGPQGTEWEAFMTEYPSVIREGNRLRLFYNGNGYGATGLGTALSSALRAVSVPDDETMLRILTSEAESRTLLRIPTAIRSAAGTLSAAPSPTPRWHGPSGTGVIWREWAVDDGSLHCRLVITPALDSLDFSLTLMNGDQPVGASALDVSLFTAAGDTPVALEVGDLAPRETRTIHARLTGDAEGQNISLKQQEPSCFS